MEQLTPLLFNYLEENARPHVQERVGEEIDDTKVNLKRDLPGTIMDYIKGVGEHAEQSNPFIAQIANHLGDDFIETVRSITETTVEIASEGMDLLLTNGVMNVAKGVIGKTTDEESGNSSGFNFDFLQSGKEGMVSTTMVLSSPVIKQVSANITKKIAAHIPAKVGGSVQEWIDQHGGSGSLLGKAAGFVAGFLNDDDDDEKTVAQGGTERDIQETGGHAGKIQMAIQKYLGPKVLSMILPYMQRFEEKMHGSLEGELRGKVFSVDYIKSKVLGMLTGGGDGASPFGALLGAFMGKAGSGGGGDDDDEGGSGGGGMKTLLMGAVMSKVAGGGGRRGGDDDEDDEGGSGGGAGGDILGALMSKVGGAKGGDDEEDGGNPLGAFAGIASQFMSQREN
ncbi:hypothetical protein BGZ81_009285 [Podila clonocystis]|nr:hypothetical protein BGZ81_009285 [Podila clonocystis]